METIKIPSPSVFLSSPTLKPAPEPPPQPPASSKRRTSSVGKATSKTANAVRKQTGETKPKQSKSRNGCITCKAKRLKCDETKPTCQQCHKRSVVCGGYKKDFKWRPFEETAVAQKAIPMKLKPVSAPTKPPSAAPSPDPLSDVVSPGPEMDLDENMEDSFFHAAAPTPPTFHTSNSLPDLNFENSSLFDMSTPPFLRELPRPRFEPDTVTRSLSSLFEDVHPPPISSPKLSLSGQSPRLIDLLLPGSELNARSDTSTITTSSMPTSSLSLPPIMDQLFHPPMEIPPALDDDIEEIIRTPQMSDIDMWMLSRGPLSSKSSVVESPNMNDDSLFKLYRQPEVQAGSPEMLMLRFDKQTCGILSVKDGPTENPWRTLVWPLARDSPALYHAIASMTAFHTSKEKPALRVDGMEHMKSSIRSLVIGIEKMRIDTALATTLVLAFSESWDQHISTGIGHLKGAKILVNQALILHGEQPLMGDDLARLKFLCNTWVYMDVIARLTSIDEDDSNNVDQVLNSINSMSIFDNDHTEVDPLMGCAASLFPLIGRAANLCRKVRRFETNSIQIISQAMELKEAVEQWLPPPGSAFERPEDPTSEIQHALQTAEAYRYATLLYLHQAVPEIPSLTSAQLAKKVLVYLATVPLSSRLVIIQIYPLLAAGCEAYDREDRQWVEQRWQSMANRMWIGNIDRCLEVMQEVWSRRDAQESAKNAAHKQKPGAGAAMVHSESSKRKFREELALDKGFSFSDLLNGASNGAAGREKQKRNNSAGGFLGGGQSKRGPEPTTEEMDIEHTVRGSAHWVGVMKDWEWEILLG